VTGLYAPVIDGRLSGPPMSLPAALADVYGCGNAAVARLERDGWRIIVRHAGSSVGPLEHVPSGRVVTRRRTARARRARLEVTR